MEYICIDFPIVSVSQNYEKEPIPDTAWGGGGEQDPEAG